MEKNPPAGRGPTMAQKVEALRRLVDEVGLVSQADLARRWGVSREAVRKFLTAEDAPTMIGQTGLYALPEVERYRSVRLRRRRRSGRWTHE